MNQELASILARIREKPNMYLGQKSISLLYSFLCGYSVCLLEHTNYTDDLFYHEFQTFVANRYNIVTDQNWCSILRFFSNDETDAFNLFFELLDEYLAK